MSEENSQVTEMHHELSRTHHDPLIRFLHPVIAFCVRILAVLMVIIIAFGVMDVAYVLFQSLASPPYYLLDVGDIFQIFGAFMVVLIGIEIFINIRMYLGSSTLPIKLVIATALMAIARKFIILDLDKTEAVYVLALAAAMIGLGVTYWLIGKTYPTRT